MELTTRPQSKSILVITKSILTITKSILATIQLIVLTTLMELTRTTLNVQSKHAINGIYASTIIITWPYTNVNLI